jgi:hypothetical protein
MMPAEYGPYVFAPGLSIERFSMSLCYHPQPINALIMKR